MSTIAIVVGGVDYTSAVVFDRSSFSTSMNAAPGSFDILIRDPARVLTFHTGVEISLTVDGIVMFGGYVTQVSMVHFAPAADTSDLATYDLRAWNLKGADYNIIFDRRIWRDASSPPASYETSIDLSAFTTDGAILRELVDNFADLTDFDSSGIVDIAAISGGDVVAQGTTLRPEFTSLSFFGGAVWYINGAKVFIYVPFEAVTKSWGFSDQPNGTTTVGFQSVEATEDGSFIENDVYVWGGSPIGSNGQIVVAHVEDSTSESTYGRWQYAELHPGEYKYKSQGQVDAAADVIVNGPPGADIYGQQKGLRYAQWQFTFKWFSSDVPGNDHVVAGDIMQIDLNTFSVSKLLPLRNLDISFPDAFVNDGTHQVQFDGTFGLQVSDPFTLWAYILNRNVRAAQINVTPAAVTPSSTQSAFGAVYQGAPTPVTDGSTTLFTLPLGASFQPYIAGSLQVYLGTIGVEGAGLLIAGTDFTETDPDAGTFTMASAPANTKFLIAVALTVPATG